MERFQVKGYATPQPEYRDALVHAEIIFPRRPFVGTNCQLLRNPSPSSLFFFSFFFSFSTDLWLALFSRTTHAPVSLPRVQMPRSQLRSGGIVDRYAFFPSPPHSSLLIRSFSMLFRILFPTLFRYYRMANDDYVYREKRGERGGAVTRFQLEIERETRWKCGGNLSSAMLNGFSFFQKIAILFFLISTAKFPVSTSTKAREEERAFFFLQQRRLNFSNPSNFPLRYSRHSLHSLPVNGKQPWDFESKFAFVSTVFFASRKRRPATCTWMAIVRIVVHVHTRHVVM